MIYFNEDLKLSYKQLDNVYNTAFSIIESLPNKAVNQLLTAYNGDIDALLTEIFRQTDSVLTLNRTLETEKLSYIEQLGESMDDTLKIHSYNYFKTTVLNNFRQGWRNLEWGNLIQLYQNSAYLAARSHGKCFIRGTRILMSDFTVKNVEDIYPGMEVMGIDYTPRKVLTRHIGFSDMYRIEQEGGMAYAVNAPHILCLFDTKKKEYVEIEAERYYSLTPLRRKRFKGYRVFSPDTPVLEKMDIVIEPIGKESYYGFMTDGDHLFQLEDGTVVHNSYEFCFAFPLWRLYSYRRPNYMKPDTPDNKNRQETCIITNTETLGKEHVDKIVEEIKANDILCHVINPNGKAVLAEKSVEGENGTKLHLRGAGGFIRGLHVGAAVSDDLPDESSIYSLEQRQKLENIFKGSISPIVEPYGYNIVDGCVSPDTFVLTDRGIRMIGELCPVPLTSPKGYYSFNKSIYNGQELELAEKYYINGETETRLIQLEKGFTLETSMIHPIMVCGDDGCYKWKKAEDICIGDFVAMKVGANIWGEPLNISDDELYQIGLSIADGHLSSDRITIAKRNAGIRQYLIDRGWREVNGVHDGIHLRYYKADKRELWASLGYELGWYSHTKVIPEKIFHAGKREITKFLSGYFDGDGCFSIDGNISCFSVSMELIRQIQFALLNLGILSSVKVKKCQSSERVKSNRMGYLLRIDSEEMINLFMKEIGFPNSGKGDKWHTFKYRNSLSLLRVPYQSRLIKAVRKQKPLTISDRKTFGLERLKMWGKKKVSIHKLRDIQNVGKWVAASGVVSEEAFELKANAERGYTFLRVKSIGKGRSITVDFTMGKTHTFFSNGIISHNTPYQSTDLYDSLKKDDKFKVFEYPAVFPDGRLLAPDRFTFEKLMAERESAGSLVFSREYLVVPISDDSTIFPWDILKRSTIGMENVRLVNNQESFPYKLDAVAVGVDFGISGAVGADYTCFTVWGRDRMGIYYLLHLYRAKGMPYDEQVQRIITLNTVFRPNAVVVENNNFQSVLGSLAIDGGVKNIIRFTTTNNKKDLRSGWPSLAALFERGVIKVPYHHDDRDKINMLFGEFNSVAFRSDKGTLESISGHDDTLSSSYMAINYLREGNVQIKIDTV